MKNTENMEEIHLQAGKKAKVKTTDRKDNRLYD